MILLRLMPLIWYVCLCARPNTTICAYFSISDSRLFLPSLCTQQFFCGPAEAGRSLSAACMESNISELWVASRGFKPPTLTHLLPPPASSLQIFFPRPLTRAFLDCVFLTDANVSMQMFVCFIKPSMKQGKKTSLQAFGVYPSGKKEQFADYALDASTTHFGTKWSHLAGDHL